MRTVPDVVYREVLGFRPLELDLHLPTGSEPVGTVVFLHGGGWRRGSRRRVPPVPGDFYAGLVREGFAVAAVSYRLSGEVCFPAQLDDVRAAVEWVRGERPGPVFLWGESAGGHLALLAALDGGDVDGVVAWYPVTDLLGLPDDRVLLGLDAETGPGSREALLLGAPAHVVPDLARAASPLAFVRADAPPVLLVHGAADDTVPPAQSSRLADALRAAGASVELDLVPGARHRWADAPDVAGIVDRSVGFLLGLRR